jgi:hypothetical protein
MYGVVLVQPATLVATHSLRCSRNTQNTITQHLSGLVNSLFVGDIKRGTNDRTEEKAKPVKEAFPSIRIVLGELDDSTVLEEEAAKADIIIRTVTRRHTCGSD